jgi:hypothetical protein
MNTGIEAGNTNENLRGTDRDVVVAQSKEKEGLPSAEDLDSVAMEQEMIDATAKALELEDEPEYVLRTEFDALVARIDAFNTRSGHRI